MTRDVNSMPDHGTKEDGTVFLESYRPPFLLALVLAFPIMPLFWSYSVKVTEDHLTFGYSFPIVAKTVNRSDVREAIPVESVNGLMEWGGWGIRQRRYQSRWETGYIPKNGGAVKVVLDDEKGSIYYFSCDSPQQVCDILNEKR